MKQYRLNKEQKIKLEQMWKTGRYNCKQLESYFKISSVAIGGLLKRRGYKIPPVGRFEKGHAKTKNWYLVMKNKVGWSKGLTKENNAIMLAHSIRMKKNNPAKNLLVRKKMSEA